MQRAIDNIYHTAPESRLTQQDPPISRRLFGSVVFAVIIAILSMNLSFDKFGRGQLFYSLFIALLALIAVLSLSVIGVFVLILVSGDDCLVERNGLSHFATFLLDVKS